MKVELHMLQNFAPSCLNRDDTNAPKDCEFGEFRRARISSQCLKRATRVHPVFAETVGTETAIRSRRLIGEITDELTDGGLPEDQAHEAAAAVMAQLAGKVGEDDRTAVAIYIGPAEIVRIVEEIQDNWDDLFDDGELVSKTAESIGKGLVKEFKDIAGAADIALFGRMVAETTDLNIDAACQVAHAISTNRASMEMDFYTAVDDLQPDADPGAGMMGTVEFNSSCFYRYALVDMNQLDKNLTDKDLADRTLDAFMRASVAAIPTGKQNSMAAQNPPSFVMAIVRDSGVPWSLVNAFEKPVWVNDWDENGLVEKSINALGAYWNHLCDMYGDGGIVAAPAAWLGDVECEPLADNQVATVEDLYAEVNGVVADRGG